MGFLSQILSTYPMHRPRHRIEPAFVEEPSKSSTADGENVEEIDSAPLAVSSQVTSVTMMRIEIDVVVVRRSGSYRYED